MHTPPVNPELVAYCGIYCGACRSYAIGRCPGCRKSEKATWCKVRTCCINNKYATCANCTTHCDPRACKVYHNPISRLFGFVFRSNRAACIQRIREVGTTTFAREMAERRRYTLPR